MSPLDAPEVAEEKDQNAIGRVVMLMVSHPKALVSFLGAIVVGLGSYTAYRESTRPEATAGSVLIRMDTTLRQVRDDVVKVKLTTDALLLTAPEKQRSEAKRIIELQLAAIHAAEEARR